MKHTPKHSNFEEYGNEIVDAIKDAIRFDDSLKDAIAEQIDDHLDAITKEWMDNALIELYPSLKLSFWIGDDNAEYETTRFLGELLKECLEERDFEDSNEVEASALILETYAAEFRKKAQRLRDGEAI